jgi:selenocysteine lyase/cysteine desulfurase
VRPATNEPPHRWETGTPSFETIAAVGACIDYIAGLGTDFGSEFADDFSQFSDRRLALKTGMAAAGAYERELVTHLIEVIQRHSGSTIAGITDPTRYKERVPTVVFTLEGCTPHQIAVHLANHSIFVWDGNYYAVEIMARLGRSEHGMVRVGLAHYNTHDEIDRFEATLQKL